MISIILPVYNKLEYTEVCLNSILKYTHIPFELVVVDDGSTDGTVDYLKRFKEQKKYFLSKKRSVIKIIENKYNLGIPVALNIGIKSSIGEYIVILHNDAIVTYNWAENLVKCASTDKKIGIVGCVSNLRNNKLFKINITKIQRYGFFNSLINKDSFEEVSFVYGFCMLINREVIRKVGYFDESFANIGWEDIDFQLMVKLAGYKIFIHKGVFVYHFRHIVFFPNLKNKIHIIKKNAYKKFRDKWKKILPKDFVLNY